MVTNRTLKERKELFKSNLSKYKARIMVCAGTGCVANGSLKVYEELVNKIKEKGLSVAVAVELEKEEKYDYVMAQSGCQGFCQMGPLVTVYPQGILYIKVKPEDAEEIIEKTVINGEIIHRLLYVTPDLNETIEKADHIPFYAGQHRLGIKHCGHIDALDMEEYIANDGYAMAERAFTKMTGDQICKLVTDSGLRGRGGGGFPTGRKWELTRIQEEPTKYIVCNGDEGDPGAFMDRCLLEACPHSVIEGMLVAAKAISATEGYIYVRTEYPLAVKRLKIAVEDAKKSGFLGKDVFGTGIDFDIHIMEGAGAFVCGEETALIASIEGKRGMPNPKPPFPAQSGLFGKPTVINNVETFANVPVVMQMGAEAYSSIGTATSNGTKTFALTGHVANTGLIEVPFGTTLRQIIGDIGGGVLNDDGTLCGLDFKAVQIGGPSGGCLTKKHLDLPLDYENLKSVGAMVGSGGLVVINEQTCMVEVARFFMQFTQSESCGKCVVCREGTKQMLNLLTDIVEGRAKAETLSLLEELAQVVKVGSLCGLGKTAPNPVLSTLKYFRDEYNAHVFEGRCPANQCEAFKKYRIEEEKCKSCGVCAKKCPVGAIEGAKGVPYVIDRDKCIKCGVCIESCKFDAVLVG